MIMPRIIFKNKTDYNLFYIPYDIIIFYKNIAIEFWNHFSRWFD